MMPAYYERHGSRNTLRKFSDGHFAELEEFRTIMAMAHAKCSKVAASEKLLGFEDSWRAYADMADEISELYRWMEQVLP